MACESDSARIAVRSRSVGCHHLACQAAHVDSLLNGGAALASSCKQLIDQSTGALAAVRSPCSTFLSDACVSFGR
jgi:hypothetical protein